MSESLYRPAANVCPMCNWRALPDGRSVCFRCVPLDAAKSKALARQEQLKQWPGGCLDCGHCEQCIERSIAAEGDDPLGAFAEEVRSGPGPTRQPRGCVGRRGRIPQLPRPVAKGVGGSGEAGKPSAISEPTEAEFTRMVIQFAKLHGWRVAHFRPAMTKSGKWVTAVQGDGKGYPDLTLVRAGRLIFAELKVGRRNKPTAEQKVWLADFAEVPGVLAVVWRPEDWPEIEAEIGRPA